MKLDPMRRVWKSQASQRKAGCVRCGVSRVRGAKDLQDSKVGAGNDEHVPEFTGGQCAEQSARGGNRASWRR